MVAGGGQTLTQGPLQVVPLQAQLAVTPGDGDAYHACRAPPISGSYLSETTMSPTPTVGLLSPVASSQLTPLPQALDERARRELGHVTVEGFVPTVTPDGACEQLVQRTLGTDLWTVVHPSLPEGRCPVFAECSVNSPIVATLARGSTFLGYLLPDLPWVALTGWTEAVPELELNSDPQRALCTRAEEVDMTLLAEITEAAGLGAYYATAALQTGDAVATIVVEDVALPAACVAATAGSATLVAAAGIAGRFSRGIASVASSVRAISIGSGCSRRSQSASPTRAPVSLPEADGTNAGESTQAGAGTDQILLPDIVRQSWRMRDSRFVQIAPECATVSFQPTVSALCCSEE